VCFNIDCMLSREILQYRWIAYSSITIGCCFVVIFLMGTKEPRLRIDLKETSRARIPWVYWFRKILYYQVAMVYLLTRLVLNVSQVGFCFLCCFCLCSYWGKFSHQVFHSILLRHILRSLLSMICKWINPLKLW
jgi:hypothetical protein